MHSRVLSRIEALENRIAPALIAAFNVSQLVGRNGFVSAGADMNDHAGTSIANIGDFNGDGLDDFIVGAPDAEGGGTGRGAAYIVLGTLDATASPQQFAAPDGTHIIAVHGATDGDKLGTAVAGAGDVNGDGFADVIIGAPGFTFSNFRVGAVYVIYGSDSAFPATIDLSAPPSGYGFRLAGNTPGDEFGSSVASAGDVNGDGLGDIIVGAHDHSVDSNPGEGVAYVVFGGVNLPAQFNVSTIDGVTGFIIEGAQNDADWGFSVAGVGDFNGDEIADVAIGGPKFDRGDEVDNGAVAIIYGHTGTFAASISVEALNGANGVLIYGAAASNAGAAVAGAGDFNADGRADIVIGAPHSGPGSPVGRGVAHVLFGGTLGSDASIDATTITTSQGFTFVGGKKPDGTGISVAGVGDLNADGFADIIIGTDPNHGNLDGQKIKHSDNAFVIFGRDFIGKPTLNASALDGSNGLVIFPKRHLGFAESVAGGGDYNGDGFADLLIGSPNDAINGPGSGSVFTVFGGQKVGDKKAFDPKRFEFVDRDGDIITIKTSKGELPREAFRLERINGDTGFSLTKVDLTADPTAFKNGKLTISVDPAAPAMAQRLATRGIANDSAVDVGEIDASGINLKKLDINGDVYIVHAGQSPPPGAALDFRATESTTPGISIFKALSIGKSATYSSLNAEMDVPNGVRELRVTGDVESLTAALTGRLTKLVVGGVIRDTTMNVNGGINSVKAKSGIENTVINVSENLKTFTVTGDITSSEIHVGRTLKTFKVVEGSMIDSQITAPGTASKTKVFNKVQIDGDFVRSRILAGYDAIVIPVNGDASIGKIKIGGNFVESVIVAGVTAGGDDRFFDGNESLVSTTGGLSTSTVAKIASIKIVGTIDGSVGGGDNFGIIAEEIRSLTIGGIAQVLVSGPANDLYPGLILGTTGDVFAVELNS